MAALTLLRNGRILRSEPSSPEPLDLLVAGDRVVALGTALTATGLPVDVVDLAGRVVIPGLVDAHVHLTGGGGEAGFHTRVPRLALSALASAGVTTAVGVLGTDGTTRTLRDLVATVYGLREEGLSAWCYTGNYALPVVTLTGSVRDDIVFVDPILGVGELALSDHRSSQPTLDELLRVASDAYVAGLTAGKAGVCHLHLGDGARGLDLLRRALATAELPPRVWHPTHLNRNPALWAEAKALAAAGGRLPFFDVTAFPAEDLGDALSAADAVADWLAAGLPPDLLTVSSDGGGCMAVFDAEGRMIGTGVGAVSTLLETLRALVAAGVDLATALPMFTANPARVLALGHKGHLAVGADADLVVLDERLHPWAVMARGRWLLRDHALLDAGRGTFERRPDPRPAATDPTTPGGS